MIPLAFLGPLGAAFSTIGTTLGAAGPGLLSAAAGYAPQAAGILRGVGMGASGINKLLGVSSGIAGDEEDEEIRRLLEALRSQGKTAMFGGTGGGGADSAEARVSMPDYALFDQSQWYNSILNALNKDMYGGYYA